MIYAREEHKELYEKAANTYIDEYIVPNIINEENIKKWLFELIVYDKEFPEDGTYFKSFVCDKEEAVEHLRELTLEHFDADYNRYFYEDITYRFIRDNFEQFFEYVVDDEDNGALTKVDDGIYLCIETED